MSLTLIEKVGKKASLFRNDMNFCFRTAGFCWCVEWLAQNGFIYNDTNDILIEACAFINKKIKTDLKGSARRTTFGIGMVLFHKIVKFGKQPTHNL